MMPKESKSPITVAQRLKKLRKATGLSRDELAFKHDIKSPSLRSWETGTRTLQKDKAELLASIFKNYGVVCTADWILRGKGEDPLEITSQTTEEAYIIKEIGRFEAYYKNSIVLEVADDYMAPWIRKGDFVGGVLIDPKDEKSFIDQICIVRPRDFGTQVRLIQKANNNKLYNLASFSNKGEILKIELEEVANILFLRRIKEPKVED
jgi:transcriptional regulator with XRE-family HTH domain